MGTVNYFVIESNVALYLDKLNGQLDEQTRETVMRLLVDEMAKLIEDRERFSRAVQRIFDGRRHIEQRRMQIVALPAGDPAISREQSLLTALERTQMLLEERCRQLRVAADPHRLQ